MAFARAEHVMARAVSAAIGVHLRQKTLWLRPEGSR
jgi:hypothetical protein